MLRTRGYVISEGKYDQEKEYLSFSFLILTKDKDGKIVNHNVVGKRKGTKMASPVNVTLDGKPIGHTSSWKEAKKIALKILGVQKFTKDNETGQYYYEAKNIERRG